MADIELEQLHVKDSDYGLIGEVDLWRNVITKALEDLSLPLTNKRYRTWRKQAYQWFIASDNDFLNVCEYAQLSPHYVLEKAYEIINQTKK